jgi:sec-independent protein translocase protein TatC
VDFLIRQRRLALLLSLVVAAFHADLITMTMVALPLYGMYEISIVVIRLVGGRRSKETETPPETPLPPATA